MLVAFHRALAAWYARTKRDLPWRRTADPYAIAISEFMLQQTQVATVVPYYERWLAAFPTWAALAVASPEAVVKQWEGLGYYARARNLHRLAQEVAARPGAELPRTIGELRALPGIGPYTAGALASLALGLRAALVDGNVIRVLTRVFGIGDDVARRDVQERLWALADALLPAAEKCAGHNSSLMELGALVCTPTGPACLLCPLRTVCKAAAEGAPERYPNKARRKAEEVEEEVALIAKGGCWWIEPGPRTGRLAGFWRFPAFDPERMAAAGNGETIAAFTYGITKYRVRLAARPARFRPGKEPDGSGPGRWATVAEMEALVMSSAHRRVRAALPSAALPGTPLRLKGE